MVCTIVLAPPGGKPEIRSHKALLCPPYDSIELKYIVIQMRVVTATSLNAQGTPQLFHLFKLFDSFFDL